MVPITIAPMPVKTPPPKKKKKKKTHGYWTMWIESKQLYNGNKIVKHNKYICIFYGIYPINVMGEYLTQLHLLK